MTILLIPQDHLSNEPGIISHQIKTGILVADIAAKFHNKGTSIEVFQHHSKRIFS